MSMTKFRDLTPSTRKALSKGYTLQALNMIVELGQRAGTVRNAIQSQPETNIEDAAETLSQSLVAITTICLQAAAYGQDVLGACQTAESLRRAAETIQRDIRDSEYGVVFDRKDRVEAMLAELGWYAVHVDFSGENLNLSLNLTTRDNSVGIMLRWDKEGNLTLSTFRSQGNTQGEWLIPITESVKEEEPWQYERWAARKLAEKLGAEITQLY
jgi:hypothetical protein